MPRPITLAILFTILLLPTAGLAPLRAASTSPDTIATARDSVAQPSTLDAPVDSKARDSMRYDIKRQAVELFGEAELTYKDQKFTSAYVHLDMSDRLLFAHGYRDSAGVTTGEPVFTEGSTTYNMEGITYNFKTKKARITGVMTEVPDGFLHGEVIKKLPDDVINIKNGKFTTCDQKHPHFYIGLTKAKVIPDDKIVTGPAYLVLADVPTPIVLPFGFFPNTTKRASGLILPEYGEENLRGFFVRQGGLYLGLSDYVDATILGSYYTKGSWDASLGINYRLRYRFTGRLGFTYSSIEAGQKGTPQHVENNSYRITWTHSQDRATHPNSTFQANVTFGSSGFNKYNSRTTNDYLNNQTMSSISYTRQFPGTPFSLSTSINHSQSSRDSIVNLSMPQIAVNMARVYPFKRKIPSGKPRWYEKIGVNYSTNLQNSLSIKENKLFTREALLKMRNGMSHQASAATSFTLLNYVNLSPSVNYNENWYLSTTRYHWVDSLQRPVRDTVQGFARAWHFNTSVSASTKLYGMYAFGPNFYVKAIRHVLTPSVSLSYRPDFADPRFKMYREVQENVDGKMRKYSIFEQGIFGGPPQGKAGTVSMSLGNNLEMKTRNQRDTAQKEKKIPLIESLSLSTGYNMLADSLNWSPLSVSARTNLFNFLSVNASSRFSPYATLPNGQMVNKYYFKTARRPLRFESFNFSCSFSLDRAITGRKEGAPPNPPLAYLPGYRPFDELANPDFLMVDYGDFSAPWRLSVSYSYSYAIRGERITTYQTASISGGFSIDPNWRVSFNTGYDFNARRITMSSFNISRDLHCWEMSLNVIPFGTMRSFSFHINVKSGVLRDLKYQKQRNYIDNLGL